MEEITYLCPERIAEYNLFILTAIQTKKADKAEVLSHKKLIYIVEGCKNL